MAKPRIERSLLFPSKEFREQVRKASKDRGFRSGRAFILANCEREIRRGDNAEAVTQFKAHVAATLRNLAKQGKPSYACASQVPMTDVLLKYVITCVVEFRKMRSPKCAFAPVFAMTRWCGPLRPRSRTRIETL